MNNKVYCDVCGTAYSEKDTHCHNCGCARPADQIGAEDSQQTDSAYTYVKGGRFSKANVRKRNQDAPRPDPVQDDELQPIEPQKNGDKTDKGLVIAVCVLLLAVVAVVIYILTKFYAPASLGSDSGSHDYVQPPVESSAFETLIPETTESVEIPTTEATVESTDVETIPTTEPVPTENTNYYVAPYTMSTEKRKNDVTIYRKGTFELEMHDASGELMDIDWIVTDTDICSVEGNTITGLKVGKTTVYVVIDNVTYSCIVRVKG